MLGLQLDLIILNMFCNLNSSITLMPPGCCWYPLCNVMSRTGCSGAGGPEQSTHLPIPLDGMLSAGPVLNNGSIYVKNGKT